MRTLLAILAITALVVSCEAGSKCAWGPSYWCQSADTAKQCGKLAYCQDSVWKSKEVGAAISCSVCKIVVGRIDDLLKENKTEDEVLAEIDQICHFLGPLRSECESFFNDSFDSIWNYLIQELDPTTVCTYLGLCGNSTMSLKKEIKLGGSIECEVCKYAVQALKSLITANSTESEIEAAIEQVCNYFGPLAGECKSLVDEYFPQIWNAVINDLDPESACTSIGLCSSLKSLQFRKQMVRDPTVCTLCDMVVNYLEDFVSQNGSEAEAEHAIETICNILPGAAKNECTEFVEENFDSIWMLFQSELENNKICDQLFNCSDTTVSVHRGATSLAKVGDDCSICKTVVEFIAHYVKANSTEEEVKNGLEKLCSLLPSSVSEKCNGLVKQYFGVIWALVQSEFNNDEICNQLNLCTSALPRYQVMVKAPAVGDEVCNICKLVAQFLEHFVDSNSSEDEVKDALEALCSLLPSNYKDQCNALLKEYFDTIWKLLKAELDSGQVCELLKLCNSTTLSRSPIKVKVSPVGADLCSLCKLVVSYIKPFVDNNNTKDEVEKALEGLCSLLPSDKDQCIKFVDTYFPMIWTLLQQEVDSGQVCEQLKLCNSTTLSRPPIKAPVQASDEECEICKYVMQYLEEEVDKNSTENEVKNFLEKACSLVKSTECNAWVNKSFNMIWQLFKEEIDSGQMCEMIGACKNSTSIRRPALKAPMGTVTCDICDVVVLFLKHFADSNSTEAEAKAAVEQLCGYLKPLEGECTQLIDNYFPMIWKLLQSYVDDDKICSEIGMCKKTVVKTVKSKAPEASVECILCEYVMKEVVSILNGSTTEAAVEAALDKVCSILPSTLTAACDAFVKEYAPMIIKLIMEEADPATVCTAIGLCKSTTRVRVTAPKASIVCTLCEFVMSELDKILGSNTSEAAVEAALEKVCDLLPSTVRKECDAFVKQYGPMILKLILQELSPDQICSALGLCSSSTSLTVASPKISADCVMCEFVMKELDSMLEENSTKAEIEGAVEKICNLLPTTIKDACDAFIEKYAPALIDALVNELDPKVICTFLKFCSNSSKPMALKSPKAGPLCIICEYVMKEVAGLIDNNSTEAEIKEVMEKVCDFLPSSVKDECISFVDQYTIQIIELLVEGVAPKLVCSVLHLCVLSDQSRPPAVTTSVSKCALCEAVITTVKDLIDSKAAQSTVEEALSEACGLLPKEISGECKGVVKDYGPPIIQLLDQEIKPEAFCEDVKLCKKTRKATNVLMQPWLKMARIREL